MSSSLIAPKFRRGLPAVACALALLATVAAAQDSDDDGVLPKYDGSDNSAAAPAAVGVSMSEPGLDVMDPTEALLSFTDLVGPTVLDTTAAPADAMFVASGPVNYAQTNVNVDLQGSGVLSLAPGYSVKFMAAQEHLVRTALLVLSPAGVSLQDLLGGVVAPTLIVPVGDLPGADLGGLQNLVTHHASALPGLSVSLVYASLDATGALHVAAARLQADGSPIEIVVH